MQRADAPVHEILKAYLSEDFLDRPQGMTTDDPRWPETRSFISELLTFLWDFPRSGTWFTDSAVTADVSLDILEKALYAVEGIYRGTETVEQAWPSKLMRFISNMESWNSRDHSSNNIFTRPTPIELRDKAIAVVQLSLRMILGDYAENGDNPIWLVGKEFLDVCFNSIENLADLYLDRPFHPFHVNLFQTPSIDKSAFSYPNSMVTSFRVSNPTQLATTSVTLLLVTTWESSETPEGSHGFLKEVMRRQCLAIEQVCGRCLISTHKPDVHRSDLDRLLPVLALPYDEQNLRSTAAQQLTNILMRRIEDGPSSIWNSTDKLLASAFRSAPRPTFQPIHTLSLVRVLDYDGRTPQDDDLLDACLGYISWACLNLPFSTLENLRNSILKKSHPAIAPTVQALDVCISNTKAGINRGLISDSVSMMDERTVDRETMARQALNHFGYPGSLTDMDAVLESESWMIDFLGKISQSLSLDLKVVAEVIIEHAKYLEKLICVIAHSSHGKCDDGPFIDSPAFLSTGTNLAKQLIQLAPAPAPKEVWASALRMLSAFVKHGSLTPAHSKSFLSFVRQGFLHKSRAVRTAAAKTLGTLSGLADRTYPRKLPELEGAFRLLSSIKTDHSPRATEPCIITLGLLGRVTDIPTQGRALESIIEYLGESNSLTQAWAYGQLLELARFHSKGPFALISPHLPSIGRCVVCCIDKNSRALTEICRFLCRTVVDFLTISRDFTIPALVSSMSKDALESMASLLKKPVGAMLLPLMPKTLSDILILPGDKDFSKACDFLTNILAKDSVPFDALLNSHRIEVVAELFITLAEESDSKLALKGLQRLRSLCTPGAKGPPSEFLQPLVLGILSHMNSLIMTKRGEGSNPYKNRVIRGVSMLVINVGQPIKIIASQIIAFLQVVICEPDLSEQAIETWRHLHLVLSSIDFAPHIGVTWATLAMRWPQLNHHSRVIGCSIIRKVVSRKADLGLYLADMVSLEDIKELQDVNEQLAQLRAQRSPHHQLDAILNRATSENINISTRSLMELKRYLNQQTSTIRLWCTGDYFDHTILRILHTLLRCVCKDGEEYEQVRGISLECLGALGALDPDRLDSFSDNAPLIVLHNFGGEEEANQFAIHLIRDVLSSAYRGASDITYHNNLAYSLQELLRLCGFTSSIFQTNPEDLPPAIASRWRKLPAHVKETVAPLLEGRFTLTDMADSRESHPLYPVVGTYREWIQRWTRDLIGRAPDELTRKIFNIFRNVVRHQDVTVARHLLPHLTLNGILAGSSDDSDAIREEIISVLQDQVSPSPDSSADKRLLSAQTVFDLLDHFSKWTRLARDHINAKRKSRSPPTHLADLLVQFEKWNSIIDVELVAQAAFQTKAYARALMNTEQQILAKKRCWVKDDALQQDYERLHEIYAKLDESDGMQGVSSLVFSPSLEHQIREHESVGRWTAAQSCWEIKLQGHPDDVHSHVGLIRSLRNLGLYDSFETHIYGLLSRNPHWSETLAGYQLEASWMIGNWVDVDKTMALMSSEAPEASVAAILLAMRRKEDESVSVALTSARTRLGAPLIAAGTQSYARSYQPLVYLHIVHDLEETYRTAKFINQLRLNGKHREAHEQLRALTEQVSARLDSTLPSFSVREAILSVYRVALRLVLNDDSSTRRELGKAWLKTAKLARKSGYSQTAYSAILQAKEIGNSFAFLQGCRLLKAEGESHRALQELENAMLHIPIQDSAYEEEHTKQTAKALLLKALWRSETDRFEHKEIASNFKDVSATLQSWESPYFHLGKYYDSVLENAEEAQKPILIANICACFASALKHGSKYIYQTMPRLLTLWLDTAAEPPSTSTADRSQADALAQYHRLVEAIEGAIRELPKYQWYSALPQVISRIEHPNKATYRQLRGILVDVMTEYPHQALWLFTSVLHSKRHERSRLGTDVVERIKAKGASTRPQSGIPTLVQKWETVSERLLQLCDKDIGDETTVRLQDISKLHSTAPCALILPLQSLMTVILPSRHSAPGGHEPFLNNAVTIQGFVDEVEIMKSLQKPRKLGILGSDGVIYNFLCKPHDDLRKDARLMDFNAMINKLLKTNSDSRRRRLHIRTYSVIPLNEECGLIEWVPNTIGFRWVLEALFRQRSMSIFAKDVTDEFQRAREHGRDHAKRVFEEKILPRYRPRFHEWFIINFAEPTSWLAARLAYSRTAAVISMVGYILGLGDRHGENILFDSMTGDTVHVDFNCLFEKGKAFTVPETVPFRLTSNIVDGMGVTGVEGVFRLASEITMQILRDNSGSLMSVLQAFVHDPLVEWEDERRNMLRKMNRGRPKKADTNPETAAMQLRAMAQSALEPIRQKLEGIIAVPEVDKSRWKKLAVSDHVEALIKEASSSANLSMMYFGWAPWL